MNAITLDVLKAIVQVLPNTPKQDKPQGECVDTPNTVMKNLTGASEPETAEC